MEIPVLFKPAMVQAIFRGTNCYPPAKSQTRRLKGLHVLNSNPDDYRFVGNTFDTPEIWATFTKGKPDYPFYLWMDDKHKTSFCVQCPFGKPWDILWVRETWRYSDDTRNPFDYLADFIGEYESEYLNRIKGTWKPSIHMPYEACRLKLRVKKIRVERVNDITDQDAIAEGVEFQHVKGRPTWKNYCPGTEPKEGFSRPFSSFETLWRSIHVKEFETWWHNPWVWVIDFEIHSVTV